jgi:hypothetical protein
MKLVFALLAIFALAIGLSACDDGNDSQKNEATIRQNSYDHLVKEEPAHTMAVSPTRKTINFWIDTWGHDPDKLSYVYLQAGNGQLVGYYIFKGLPVTYCAALTPTYEFVGTPDDGSDDKNQQVPAPSVDGVYYSGGQCDSYYGRDATTGAYIEYTVGGSQNVLVYDRPLPRQNVEPLGFAKVDEYK